MEAEAKQAASDRSTMQGVVRSLITRLKAVLRDNDPTRTRQCEELSSSLLDHQIKHDALLQKVRDLYAKLSFDIADVDDKAKKLKSETTQAYKEATDWVLSNKQTFGTDVTARESPEETGAGRVSPTESIQGAGPEKRETDKELIARLREKVSKMQQVEDDLEDARYQITSLQSTASQLEEENAKTREHYEVIVDDIKKQAHADKVQADQVGRDLMDETHRADKLQEKLDHELSMRRDSTFAPRGESTRMSMGGDDMLMMSQIIAQSNASVMKEMLSQSQSQQKSFIDTLQSPKIEIKKFSGDYTEYHSFISRYDDLVGKTDSSYGVKLNTLLQYCEDTVRKHLDCCNYKSAREGYDLARTILKTKYGNPFLVSQAWVERMLEYPNLSKAEEMMKFASELRSCFQSLTSLGYLADLENTGNMKKIVAKVPSFVQNRWRKINREQIKAGKKPSLKDLIDIIDDTAEEMNDPIYGNASLKKVSAPADQRTSFKSGFKKRVTANTVTDKQTPPPGASGSGGRVSGDPRKTPRKIKCAFCKEEHYPRSCPQYVNLLPADKLKLVYERRLCILCLNPSHVVADCRMTWTCQKEGCKRKHNTTLHEAFITKVKEGGQPVAKMTAADPDDEEDESDDDQSEAMMHGGSAESYSVPVVPVSCQGWKYELETNALVDTGASLTFITRRFYDRLMLKAYGTESFTMTSLTDTVSFEADLVNFDIRAVDDSRWKTAYRVAVVDELPISSAYVDRVNYVDRWPYLKELKMCKPYTDTIDILIGQSNAKLFKQQRMVEGPGDGQPYAVRTHVGWLLMGHYVKRPKQEKLKEDPNKPIYQYKKVDCVHMCTQLTANNEVDEDLSRKLDLHWQGEVVPDVTHEDPVNAEIIKMWDRETRVVDGHMEIPIPIKNDPPNMPDNKHSVLKRFRSLTKRLEKDDDLKEKYVKSMNENFKEGYIRECVDEPRQGYLCYHPQQPVINERRPGKCRVVGDLGHVCGGTCLNAEIHQGPNYTADLVAVVVRFRKYQIAVTADIKAMYNRVRVPLNQVDLLRFFWWRSGVLNGEMIECQALTHMFGGGWSPAVCMYGLQWAAEHYGEDYEQVVVDTILKHFYVDDLLRSICSTEAGIIMITGVRSLLSNVGFDLIKVGSNDQAILDSVPEYARAVEYKELELDMREDTVTHTLGSVWKPVQDLLSFRVVKLDKPATRRGVLSTSSSLYDPMGLIAPFILRARILLQKLCKLKLGWDEQIPGVYNEKWTSWLSDVPLIPNVKIPRWLGIIPDAGQHYEIHVFVDASSEGYGAAVYLTVMDQHGDVVGSNLVCAKAKVAPMTAMTIPRMELTAAVLGVKLERTVRAYLELDLPPATFWSDSMIVLWYVRGQSWKFKLFVANRIAYLQKHTESRQWKYVPTELNPADAASRGMSATELQEKIDWLRGPEFLSKRELMPDQPNLSVSKDKVELKKLSDCGLLASESRSCDVRRTLLRSHSNWITLIRRIAVLKKVARYIKTRKYKCRPFTAEEIRLAELTAIRLIQEEHLTDKQRKSKMFRKLFPYDHDGICRVGGRLMMSSLTFEEKYPPILPDCEATRTFIRYVHDKHGHHGIDRTYYDTRSMVWILGGKAAVKRAVGNCVWCRRLRGRPPTQLMAPLPQVRVTPGTVPFENVGVDYFGPFYVKVGRALVRRFACAITCLQSRAAHIEIAYDLTTTAFLNALQRFMARRGKPKVIMSDNGTNFVGAKRELKEALKGFNDRYIGNKLAVEGIDWKFNVPLASHHGGVWERLIRSYRCTFHGLVKGQTLTDETLATFAALVEQVLNSRPLTRVTESVDDLEVITPNHLLTLRKTAGITGDFNKGSTVRSKWKQLEYLADIFWKRWTRTYLQELQIRQKWTSPSDDLKVDEMILLVDEHAHRLDWPLGRVVEVYKGRDGHVRSAMIRTQTGRYKRPISKIVRLECDN